MGILITPNNAICGGKSCYAFPNGEDAHGHTCPGDSITISIGGSGNSIESNEPYTDLICLPEGTSCNEFVGEEEYDGCAIIGCGPVNPDLEGPCTGSSEELEILCNNDCENTYATLTYTIDPNSTAFADALGWSLNSCPGNTDPSVKRSAEAYITGGSWRHACINRLTNPNSVFGGESSTFDIPFFPNGKSSALTVDTRNGACGTAITLSTGTSSVWENEICLGEASDTQSCVEVFVHPIAGIFSPDEVVRNIECYDTTADGEIVSRLMYQNIPKDAAVFLGRTLFRSNKAFTIYINYDTVTCGNESEDKPCMRGVGIDALKLNSEKKSCNVVSGDPMKLLRSI